jgi:rhodanese-related sulfurtransferase
MALLQKSKNFPLPYGHDPRYSTSSEQSCPLPCEQTRMKLGRQKTMLIVAFMVAVLAIGSLLMWRDIRVAPRVQPGTLLTVAHQDTTILDVRSMWEYESGHIPGAEHAAFWSPSQLLNLRIPLDATVVIYCELGPRAAWAKWTLQLAGYRDVRYLQGHMAGWREAKMPEDSLPTLPGK